MTPTSDKPSGKKTDALLMIATPKKPGGRIGGDGPPPLGEPDGGGAGSGECSSCAYFDGSNRCLKFPPLGGDWARVLPEDWCSFYEAGTPHSSGDAGEPTHAEPDADDTGKAQTPGIGGF